MKVGKAKRRLRAWALYVRETRSMTNHPFLAGWHRGHTKAYSDVIWAGRPQGGLRDPGVWATYHGGDSR